MKIVFGVRPLKAGERYATKDESIAKGQIRQFGLYAITEARLEEGKRKKIVKAPVSISKYARQKMEKEILTLIRQINVMEDSLEYITTPNQVDGVKQLIREQKKLLDDLFRKQAEQIKMWDDAGQPETMPKKKIVKKI